MKTLLSICLVFLVFQAKSQDLEIPRNTFKIIIHNEKSKQDNFKMIGQLLTDNDIMIDKSNSDFFVITTGQIPVKKGDITNIYNFACKDSSIAITGQFNSNISFTMYGVRSESSFEKILYKGMAGSLYKKAFVAMNDLAIKIEHKYIEYVPEK